MLVDIQIIPKTLEAVLKFEVENFKSDKCFKNAIATITMVAADYSLDPEFELSDLQGMVKVALKDSKRSIVFSILEDGIEAELVN
jgi:hypothetical protein